LIAAGLVMGLTLEATAAAAQPPSYPQQPYPQQSYPQQPYPSSAYPQQPYPPQGYAPPPSYNGPPPGYAQSPPPGAPPIAPPQGQYAPPPPGSEQPGAVYDDGSQRYDREYATRYSQWAAQYCVDRRNNNTAAGAIIGGILGAVVGSNVAGSGSKTGGSIIGGALGATAGAAIGANSASSAACPPGYVVRAGAPTFYYGPPAYGPAAVYAPGWYNPWFFEGGVWVYRPYRYWYWTHDAYWHPGYRPGPWAYHYRRY
jgi:hypothetical protein